MILTKNHYMFEKHLRFLLIDLFWRILVPLKMNNMGVGSQGRVRKSRNHEHEGFFGFSRNESEKLLVRSEAK